MTSLFKLAEQCKHTLGKGDIQSYIPYIISAYGQVAKKQWYENTAQDTQELNGSFIYDFPNKQPIFDNSYNMYSIDIPSSYLELPHDMGVDYLGYMTGGKSFIRVNNWALHIGLRSSVFGGRQPFMLKGKKVYFPKMTRSTALPVMIRLAIALDTTDVLKEINIGQNMQNEIISIVCQILAPTPKLTPETLQ